MKAWLYRGYTDAHRTRDRQDALMDALAERGVSCVTARPDGCDVAVLGGANEIFQGFVGACREYDYRGPVAYYCWDLYPWLVGPDRPAPVTNYDRVLDRWWQEYLARLRDVDLILVPSESVRKRVREFAGRDSAVVWPSCNPFEEPVWDGGYVMQSMRDYVHDPNHGMLDRACAELGVPLVRPDGSLPAAEFRRAVAGARVLVSPYREASTGGLALLEGYRLGKPVLVCGSEYQGAREYFGHRGARFTDGSYDDLKARLEYAINLGPQPVAQLPLCREWVDLAFSDAAFAGRLSEVLTEFLS